MNDAYTVLKETDPDLAAKLEEFIAKLQGCLSCTSPFSIVSLFSTYCTVGSGCQAYLSYKHTLFISAYIYFIPDFATQC